MNPSIPIPAVALMNSATVYAWSDGTLYNGFLLIQLISPSGYTHCEYGNNYPSIRLPAWQRIPIVNGTANSGCGLFVNSSISPPGSLYNCYFYDATGTQIAGPSATFTVLNTNPFSPPVIPSLPKPSAGAPVTPD